MHAQQYNDDYYLRRLIYGAKNLLISQIVVLILARILTRTKCVHVSLDLARHHNMSHQLTKLTIALEPGVDYDLSFFVNLETLTLTSTSHLHVPSVILPTNLCHLYAFKANVFLLNVFDCTALETLECEFISSTRQDNLPGAIIPLGRQLPTSLKTLKATFWGAHLHFNPQIGRLHNGLVSLELAYFFFSFVTNVITLPKTLLRFKVGEFLACEFYRLESLPFLQELHLYTNEGHLLPSYLPDTLTVLTLKDGCSLPIELPPRILLKKLDFCGSVAGSVINIPSSVTDLSLNYEYSGTDEVFDLHAVQCLEAFRVGDAKFTSLRED